MEPLDSLSLRAKEIKQRDFSHSNQNSALLLDVLISCRASDFHSILRMSQIGMQSLSWQRFWLEIVGLAQVFPIIRIKSEKTEKGPVAALAPVGSLERLCYADWNLTLVKFY